MKKVIILLTGLMMTAVYAGGYYPSYGPGEQWDPSASTLSGFVLFNDISLNGSAVSNGTEGGATGECDTGDCDIIGVMYNGIAVGWSFMPIVGNAVTVVVELNDGVTAGLEEYPQYVAGTFAPVVTFNFYDASEGQMYYNVGAASPEAQGMVNFGSLDVTGNGTFCSSDGFAFGATDFCSAGTGCDNAFGGCSGDWDTFDVLVTVQMDVHTMVVQMLQL